MILTMFQNIWYYITIRINQITAILSTRGDFSIRAIGWRTTKARKEGIFFFHVQSITVLCLLSLFFTVCSTSGNIVLSASSHILCSTAPFWAISVRLRIALSVPIDFHTKIFFQTAGTAMQSQWVPGGLALACFRHHASKVKSPFIYIALLTMQIVSKQLHNIKIGK